MILEEYGGHDIFSLPRLLVATHSVLQDDFRHVAVLEADFALAGKEYLLRASREHTDTAASVNTVNE